MEEWVQRALALGADAARAISVEQVVVSDWVRRKCQFGCGGYGQCLTCPPHSPTPEATRRMLQDYRKGLLLRVEGRGEDEEEPAARRLAETVAALERELFLSGHYRAWGMVAGPCPFCETCNLAGPCRFPEKARPSMEACGIDVYATVRAAGWRIEVVPSLDAPFRLFGLVLVE